MKPDAPDASGSPRGPHSHGRGLATVREALAGSRNDDLRIWLEMSLQVQRRQVLHLLEQHHEGVLAELSNKLGAPWQSGDEDSLKKMQPSSDPVLMAELDSLVTLSSATATGTAVEDSREKLPIGLDKDMHRLSISTAGTGAESVAVSRRWSRKTTTTAHLINEEDSVKPLSFQQPSTWVRHPLFESFCCLLIVGNTLVMALEIQYIGLQQGYELRYPKFTQPAEEVWPRAVEIFHSLENVFGAMFTVELLCRMMAFGREFLYDSWSWFDLAIVLAWLADLIVQGIIPIEPMVLRIARLARLLRLIRLVRAIQGFDALYILTTSLKGSLTVVFWSFILIFVVQMAIGFVLNQFLLGYMENEDLDLAVRLKLFEYFGTTSRTILTMFELSLANWPPVARILQEDVSVVNGVFMQETFKVAANDDSIMMRQTDLKRQTHEKKISALFEVADTGGEGLLCKADFCEALQNQKVRSWLAAQELDVTIGAPIMFDLLGGGKPELTVEDLVDGIARLKGTARSVDLSNLMFSHRAHQDRLEVELKRLSRLVWTLRRDSSSVAANGAVSESSMEEVVI